MDLLSFIQTANLTKVRVAERQRVENKPRLLESTVGRVVPLLPIAPARASSELEASDVAPLQPRRQRKRKTVVVDASGPSHPPKKLREDYGALGGASTAGKSRYAVQSLFTRVVLNVEARGEPILTLPFVTSSVSATPEHEDKIPADSITELNLQTIGAPQRFVISSDSSHHSGANIAEAEVDSIVRSSAPAIAIVITVTAAVDADAMADRVPVAPSLFGVGSSSTGRIDFVPNPNPNPNLNGPKIDKSALIAIHVHWCRPMRKEEIASWDGGKSTWGGRVRVFGTVSVSLGAQEIVWERGRFWQEK
nr:hypothetical protein [Tanacetum cinerariifolium]